MLRGSAKQKPPACFAHGTRISTAPVACPASRGFEGSRRTRPPGRDSRTRNWARSGWIAVFLFSAAFLTAPVSLQRVQLPDPAESSSFAESAAEATKERCPYTDVSCVYASISRRGQARSRHQACGRPMQKIISVEARPPHQVDALRLRCLGAFVAGSSSAVTGSWVKRSSPATPCSKVSRAWEGSPRCPAVVAPSRSMM